MTDTTQPTDEGRRRYPATDGYHADLSSSTLQPDLDNPCTCVAACHARCSGECGCRACGLQFAMFCDVAGLSGSEPWTEADEENALKAYRGPVL